MILDHLIHSYVDLKILSISNMNTKGYISDVLKWKFNENDGFKSLTIGGGGYTFPRYMEITYPKAHIDVVEIDPQVTQVVYEHLNMPKNTKINYPILPTAAGML
jgi:hypothetical protein